MKVIGIVGGIASGKSLVTSMLREFGARVVDADRLGHLALEDSDVQRRLQRRWGDVIFQPPPTSPESSPKSSPESSPHSNGENRAINRQAIARIVFAEDAAEELRFLERAVHPFIATEARALLATYRAEQVTAVVLDAALLLEAGWDQWCDAIVFVDTPTEQRRQRVLSRGWTEHQWQQREATQLPLEEKRRRADFVLDNSRTPEQTQRQLQTFWDQHVLQTTGCGP